MGCIGPLFISKDHVINAVIYNAMIDIISHMNIGFQSDKVFL